jgi:RNA polymerase sigma factor (sigma-70 family)
MYRRTVHPRLSLPEVAVGKWFCFPKHKIEKNKRIVKPPEFLFLQTDRRKIGSLRYQKRKPPEKEGSGLEEIGTWVVRLREGDLSAFDAILRKFQDMAMGYAYSLLGDYHSAEDAAQEAFLTAFREISQLKDPSAFPGWFRALVRTQCHRILRKPRLRLLPLDALAGRSDPETQPERIADSRALQAEVRSAIDALPETQREALLLYYFSGYAVQEIAAFLNLPASTVKNRLHAARKRLRERLAHQVEENVKENRPSKDGRFVAEALRKAVDEFRRRRREDPSSADRSLLRQEKKQLEDFLQTSEPEPEIMRPAWALFDALGDPEALLDVLIRYRSQSIPSEEEAWARYHETSALAALGRCAEAAERQSDFYRWALRLPAGETPTIDSNFPFEPLEKPDAEILAPESLLLFVMGNGGQAKCWVDAGRGDEWLAIFDEVMERTPKTERNRFRRFNYLRTAVAVLVWMNRGEEARRLARRIGALAEEEASWEEAQRWKIEEWSQILRMDAKLGDFERAGEDGPPAVALIEEYARRLSPLTPEREGRLRSFCHNIGCPLAGARRYDLALPLLRRATEGGRGSDTVYLMLACCLWATESDREEAKATLRQAGYRHPAGTLLGEIESLPEFAPFLQDPEFRAALAGVSSSSEE